MIMEFNKELVNDGNEMGVDVLSEIFLIIEAEIREIIKVSESPTVKIEIKVLENQNVL